MRVRATIRVQSTPTTDLGIAFPLRLVSHPLADVAFSPVRPAGGMTIPSTQWIAGWTFTQKATLPWLLPQPPEPSALRLVVHLYDLDTGHSVRTVVISP